MKKSYSKVVKIVSLTAIMSILLSGCGSDDPLSKLSKKDLIAMIHDKDNTLDALDKEFEDYKQITKGIQSESEVTAAISIVGDGTGRYAFNVIQDSKIIFPNQFVYPGAEPITGDGNINIVTNVSISPSANWITKLNGSTLELENTDAGISGTIKVGEQHEVMSIDELRTAMTDWFTVLPPSQVNYSNISVAKNPYGIQATTPIQIESEDAFMRCGMFATPDSYCITYVFVYRGSEDQSKNESITNLLNSITVLGKEVIVEQR